MKFQSQIKLRIDVKYKGKQVEMAEIRTEIVLIGIGFISISVPKVDGTLNKFQFFPLCKDFLINLAKKKSKIEEKYCCKLIEPVFRY